MCQMLFYLHCTKYQQFQWTKHCIFVLDGEFRSVRVKCESEYISLGYAITVWYDLFESYPQNWKLEQFWHNERGKTTKQVEVQFMQCAFELELATIARTCYSDVCGGVLCVCNTRESFRIQWHAIIILHYLRVEDAHCIANNVSVFAPSFFQT